MMKFKRSLIKKPEKGRESTPAAWRESLLYVDVAHSLVLLDALIDGDSRTDVPTSSGNCNFLSHGST